MKDKEKKKKAQQNRNELTKLIEMPPPSWLTESSYLEYKEDFDIYKQQVKKQFKVLVGQLVEVNPDTLHQNPQHGFVDVSVNAKFFMDLWKQEKLISPPSTGQDPKSYNPTNEACAREHFANMWGNENGSEWINAGVLNMCLYPGHQIVTEATDIEHRLWGIIAGGNDWITLPDSGDELFFQHPSIERKIDDTAVRSIKVNGLSISGIVEKANKYCKEGRIITYQDVINRYLEGRFTLRLLPMYDEVECHNFYGKLNKNSSKSEAQLTHAFTYPSNLWIKEISSIKLSRFKPGKFNLHPLYEQLYNNTKLVNLDSFMNAHVILQYLIKGYFVSASPGQTKKQIEDSFGYGTMFTEDKKTELLESLDLLYKFFNSCDKPYITHHISQQILHSLKYIDEHDKVIADWDLFSNKLMDFINTERVHQYDDPDEKFLKNDKTALGKQLGGQDINKSYKKAFQYIRNRFLSKCIGEDSLEYGVCDYSERIPRLFSKKVINDSYSDENGLDVDGAPFDNPVGGHRISDFELIRMTNEERIEAYKKEGLGNEFDFDLNCRAMSSYHNNRMKILRLSEYRTVMHLDNNAVKKAIASKYESYKGKPILV